MVNFNRALQLTELSEDELVSVVGIFKSDHWRFAGKPKGELLEYSDGKIVLRHHFTKRRLWSSK